MAVGLRDRADVRQAVYAETEGERQDSVLSDCGTSQSDGCLTPTIELR